MKVTKVTIANSFVKSGVKVREVAAPFIPVHWVWPSPNCSREGAKLRREVKARSAESPESPPNDVRNVGPVMAQ